MSTWEALSWPRVADGQWAALGTWQVTRPRLREIWQRALDGSTGHRKWRLTANLHIGCEGRVRGGRRRPAMGRCELTCGGMSRNHQPLLRYRESRINQDTIRDKIRWWTQNGIGRRATDQHASGLGQVTLIVISTLTFHRCAALLYQSLPAEEDVKSLKAYKVRSLCSRLHDHLDDVIVGERRGRAILDHSLQLVRQA
jgi:hypothetical protein